MRNIHTGWTSPLKVGPLLSKEEAIRVPAPGRPAKCGTRPQPAFALAAFCTLPSFTTIFSPLGMR